jgi:type IV pilus assembly protein PilV
MWHMNTSSHASSVPGCLPGSHRQGGFSLLELSMATAIYSMGLGSLSLMMLLAVQGTTEARQASTAAMQASSLAEMILMNADAMGHYVLPPGENATFCGLGQACSPEEMAAWQLEHWQHRLASDLPNGSGLVCRDRTPDDGDIDDAACDGESGLVIKVFWQAPVSDSEPDAPRTRQVLLLP